MVDLELLGELGCRGEECLEERVGALAGPETARGRAGELAAATRSRYCRKFGDLGREHGVPLPA